MIVWRRWGLHTVWIKCTFTCSFNIFFENLSAQLNLTNSVHITHIIPLPILWLDFAALSEYSGDGWVYSKKVPFINWKCKATFTLGIHIRYVMVFNLFACLFASMKKENVISGPEQVSILPLLLQTMRRYIPIHHFNLSLYENV